MPSKAVSANIVFVYYKDLARAADFYARVMGLDLTVDQGFAKIFRVTDQSYIGLVDSEHGTLKASDTKPVIIAFVTEDPDGWYDHLVANGVTIFMPKYDSDRSQVRGFMAQDPEGYVLEFEWFKETERNRRILEILRARG
ncbi:MAG: VOC family protein [Chloroflexi bacterium]|nr:VOC family protein [Chloroflexota bacterium]